MVLTLILNCVCNPKKCGALGAKPPLLLCPIATLVVVVWDANNHNLSVAIFAQVLLRVMGPSSSPWGFAGLPRHLQWCAGALIVLQLPLHRSLHWPPCLGLDGCVDPLGRALCAFASGMSAWQTAQRKRGGSRQLWVACTHCQAKSWVWKSAIERGAHTECTRCGNDWAEMAQLASSVVKLRATTKDRFSAKVGGKSAAQDVEDSAPC